MTISGVTEPIIGQRSDKTVIQFKDGEPCLLAGILSKQDNYSNSGTPGLSQIPLIKYLFGTINKEVQDDEVVFILIPHIVRESVLTRLNTRSIDTGTGTDHRTAARRRSTRSVPGERRPGQRRAGLEYHRRQRGNRHGAADEAAGHAAQARAAAIRRPRSPPAAAAGPPVTLTMVPANSTQTVGSTFQASVLLSNAHDVFTVPLEIQFDPKSCNW